MDRADLRRIVQECQRRLEKAGLTSGGTVALRLPPSLCYVGHLLASWRIGAQVTVLDHRLTEHEAAEAVKRIDPQVVVSPKTEVTTMLRGYVEVTARYALRAGTPARTAHALLQLSSGSTGNPKIIGRGVHDLLREIDRYRQTDGMPGRGERVVQLSSIAHSFGLVGGLLHSLHAGVLMTLPKQFSAASILDAVTSRTESATLLGVPFHYGLLTTRTPKAGAPQLARAVSGGEKIRPEVAEQFTEQYGIPLGECYGMTETGFIALDFFGRHRPALGPVAPGVAVRVEKGELLVRAPENPYLSTTDASRWTDGWLRTRDAAALDADTEVLTVTGRLDSQVSVGGLKVDLTEVEQVLAALPGVHEAVVVFAGHIVAYLTVAPGTGAAHLRSEMRSRLAAFKRPRRLHLLSSLPRTSTGKLVRDLAVLRAAAADNPSSP
ncbi:acyl--CoA ligase [Streptomyces sp. NBC_00289]|uniref:class I adenylate-forming enzyme family protein n=1 Tax=Streptomyces sp. NBC_00289 TaxID=2975703 RepID=UPI003255E224